MCKLMRLWCHPWSIVDISRVFRKAYGRGGIKVVPASKLLAVIVGSKPSIIVEVAAATDPGVAVAARAVDCIVAMTAATPPTKTVIWMLILRSPIGLLHTCLL